MATEAGHQGITFSLDGRLIGDIGEVIAGHFFDLKLTQKQ
jgi:hypothetical protein